MRFANVVNLILILLLISILGKPEDSVTHSWSQREYLC